MTECFDVAVIGAGLIGASAACHLSEHCKVVVLEQEPRPGYHSSGRSAAVLLPSYGGPLARALTSASVDFLTHPPEGFSHFPMISDRGCIFVASESQQPLLSRWQQGGVGCTAGAQMLDAHTATQLVPILDPQHVAAALLLPDVKDIDAAALLQGYLRTMRARGGSIQLGCTVQAIERREDVWRLDTTTGRVVAKTLVNAAGAWADELAELAGVARQGIVPTRRTMIVVAPPETMDVRRWPLVADVGETFYFKPDGARLVVSPCDRTPVAAHDVQAEELDIAVAVDRIETATRLRVQRVEHRWAGLRTFAPDDEPIIGFDAQMPEFLWVVGFGGFGVQSAPAAGQCCAALWLRRELPETMVELGVDLRLLSPRRLAGESTGTA